MFQRIKILWQISYWIWENKKNKCREFLTSMYFSWLSVWEMWSSSFRVSTPLSTTWTFSSRSISSSDDVDTTCKGSYCPSALFRLTYYYTMSIVSMLSCFTFTSLSIFNIIKICFSIFHEMTPSCMSETTVCAKYLTQVIHNGRKVWISHIVFYAEARKNLLNHSYMTHTGHIQYTVFTKVLTYTFSYYC